MHYKIVDIGRPASPLIEASHVSVYCAKAGNRPTEKLPGEFEGDSDRSSAMKRRCFSYISQW